MLWICVKAIISNLIFCNHNTDLAAEYWRSWEVLQPSHAHAVWNHSDHIAKLVSCLFANT